ncbi:DUF222 domain-containing protein [Sinomonas sp. ASV486]|uniref:HNH endonuclease signature motif containing protein n=1 Tax=Sinomonas sp. ASV486 TaxID=3051170 RepID=UPI0027DB5237|nr:DUF222 domain-containing protein [Sinomonas sp. ASV486]MDQ4489828.1 DUF222 domain-containing protein [Sinomonas sp. ASV486]
MSEWLQGKWSRGDEYLDEYALLATHFSASTDSSEWGIVDADGLDGDAFDAGWWDRNAEALEERQDEQDDAELWEIAESWRVTEAKGQEPESAPADRRDALEYAALLVRALERSEAAQARLDAGRIWIMAELVKAEGGADPDLMTRLEAPGLAASEVAAALRIPQRTARARIEEARALTDRAMAPVLEGMRQGRLNRQRAAIAVDAAVPVPAGRLADFAAAAAEIAAPTDPQRTPTPGALGRRLRRLAEDYATEPLAVRKSKAVAGRRVDVSPVGDGMCCITALLPLEDGALIDTRLGAIARSLHGPNEHRTFNQLRADAFRDLVLGSASLGMGPVGMGHLATGPLGTDQPGAGRGEWPAPGARAAGPDAGGTEGPGLGGAGVEGPGAADTRWPQAPLGGVRMQLVLTAAEATVNGTSDAPGEILGYGPIDAETTKRLAAQTTSWSRMVVGAKDGAPLSIGRISYAPTASMRRFLALRDATCRFPGCDKPAAATEADHTVEWQHGGNTDVANLALLCPEHHRLKSLGYWTARHLATDTATDVTTLDDASAAGVAPAVELRTGSASELGAGSEPVPARPPGTLEWRAPSGRTYITYPRSEDPPPF